MVSCTSFKKYQTLYSSRLSKHELKIERKDDFWHQVRSNFRLLHYTHKAVVQAQIYWFSSHANYLNLSIKRAAPYIHYIHEQLRKRNLPTELVLLPIVESSYNPLAINRSSGASGLWQLMPGTARGFGIRQDWLFDGRRDIYTSTHAALDYLTYLQHFFSGEWLLALAAYDTGEGNVQRAIRYNARQNLSTHFWSLPLALETRSYIPRLLALAAIVKNPKKYGMNLPDIGNKPYLGQVDVSAGVSILQAAALADISLKRLKRFNPGFKQITFIPRVPYKLLLPTDYIDQFKKGLATLPIKSTSSNWQGPQQARYSGPAISIQDCTYYRTQRGDTLSGIAKQYRVSVNNLRHWNGLKPTDLLKVDKLVIIYENPASKQAVRIHPQQRVIQYYRVKPGDTLSEIAYELDVQVMKLKNWNQLRSDILQVGQRLKVYPHQ